MCDNKEEYVRYLSPVKESTTTPFSTIDLRLRNSEQQPDIVNDLMLIEFDQTLLQTIETNHNSQNVGSRRESVIIYTDIDENLW